MLIFSRVTLLFVGLCSLVAAQTNESTVLGEVLTALEHAVDCTSCLALLGVLKGVAELGDSIFSNTFVTICDLLHVIIFGVLCVMMSFV